MGINCISDIINRLERMQDEIERMVGDVRDMSADHKRDHPMCNLETDDYYYGLYKADLELDGLSSAITETLYQLEQVRYA